MTASRHFDTTRRTIQGRSGSFRVTRGPDGRPALALADEQVAIVEAQEWVIVPPAAIPSDDDDPDLVHALQVKHVCALYLYSSGPWLPGTVVAAGTGPNEESAVIWDARDTDARGFVPYTIAGPSGRAMVLRAVSADACPDWPVARGDRVFIELTPARARQLAYADTETLQALHPAHFAERVAQHGSPQTLVDGSAQWMLDKGWPDTAHVTEAMRAAIAERQVEASSIDDLLGQLVRELVSAGAVPAVAVSLDRLLANEYERVLMPMLVGEMTRGRTIAGVSLRSFLDDGERLLACTASDFCDASGAPLTEPDWISMRADDGYCRLAHGEVHNSDLHATLHLRCEWVGAVFRVGVVATDATAGENIDIGAVVNVRLVADDPRVEPSSPWIGLRCYARHAGTDPVRVLAEEVASAGASAAVLSESLRLICDAHDAAVAAFAVRDAAAGKPRN